MIPGIGLIIWIILGIFGNQWAWQHKRWDSIESFKKTQRKWTIAGLVVLGILALLFLLGIIITVSEAIKPFADILNFFQQFNEKK